MDATDRLGNSLLHICVLHTLPERFTYLVTNHRAKILPILGCKNKHGYSPLFLAAYTRNHRMFCTVENATCTTVWEFGRVSCQLHSLEDIDNLVTRKRGEESLLEFMVAVCA